MTELLILGAFSLILLVCVVLDVSVLWALALGWLLFACYCLGRHFSLRQVCAWSLDGVRAIKTILLTFLLIGMITAVWRICGTIPCIVHYATALCTPSLMLLMTFLICCLVSVLTGTAFGTAATAGVICAAMANSMGISPLCIGGAVLSGSFFGDRCSPMSTSALLISELTKTDIFRNLWALVRTSLLPFAIACAAYLALGFTGGTAAPAADVQAVFSAHFTLRPVTVLPAALIVLLSLCRVRVKAAMAVSVLAGIPIALFVEGAAPSALLRTLVLGFHAADPALAALLDGGGIVSMVRTFAIVCLSSCYAGIFDGTGFLDSIKTRLTALSARTSPFCGVLLAAAVTGVIACNQTLSIMLTHQLCRDTEDAETLAVDLENTAVVVSPLIPWSIAAAVPLSAVGAPSAGVFAAVYLWLLPVWNLSVSLLRRKTAEKNTA